MPFRLFGELIANAEKFMPNETGGLIVGRICGGSEWLLTHITMPGPKAVHGRYSYKPDYGYDEHEIARIYQETNCESVYLGDWHSHPNSKAYMSEKDTIVLRTIAKSRDARISNPIMIILGTSPFELCCWGYKKAKLLSREFSTVTVRLSNDYSK